MKIPKLTDREIAYIAKILPYTVLPAALAAIIEGLGFSVEMAAFFWLPLLCVTYFITLISGAIGLFSWLLIASGGVDTHDASALAKIINISIIIFSIVYFLIIMKWRRVGWYLFLLSYILLGLWLLIDVSNSFGLISILISLYVMYVIRKKFL